MELSGGHYHVLARLKVSDNAPDAVVATLYVRAVRNGVEQVVASRDIRASEFHEPGKWQVFVLPADINEDDEDVRIGVEFHPGVADLWCDWIRVQLAGLLHTGLFERGGIRDLEAIKDGLFTADAAGRAKFEPGFVNNALIYPDIDASKITSGVLDVARIPDLDASKITSGVLDAARIPDLDASKITSGVLSLDRIPAIPYEKLDTELRRGLGRYWEAEDHDGTTGSDVSDSTAAGGMARKASSSDPSGTLVEVA
mgnify:CR=1 FL=1